MAQSKHFKYNYFDYYHLQWEIWGSGGNRIKKTFILTNYSRAEVNLFTPTVEILHNTTAVSVSFYPVVWMTMIFLI